VAATAAEILRQVLEVSRTVMMPRQHPVRALCSVAGPRNELKRGLRCQPLYVLGVEQHIRAEVIDDHEFGIILEKR
jgi:hypothetical protein